MQRVTRLVQTYRQCQMFKFSLKRKNKDDKLDFFFAIMQKLRFCSVKNIYIYFVDCGICFVVSMVLLWFPVLLEGNLYIRSLCFVHVPLPVTSIYVNQWYRSIIFTSYAILSKVSLIIEILFYFSKKCLCDHWSLVLYIFKFFFILLFWDSVKFFNFIFKCHLKFLHFTKNWHAWLKTLLNLRVQILWK